MRAKVQAAAEAAGYRPDPAVARVMAGFRQQRRAGTRGTIAAIFPPGMRVPTDPRSPASAIVRTS
jgi:DNA-binding LacI/PurR family transcriptional regulator